ncbi:MAG: hypothetical protein AAF404_00190 [Pseudomonadota bacterium]
MQNCAALLGYRLDFPEAAIDIACLRADPVFQQLDINQAVLADHSVLALQPQEATAIVDDLNKHFAEDGVRFQSASADRWYCLLPRELQVSTQSPGNATGRSVSLTMARGPDAGTWRGWLSEIEMLLYAHPVNQQRAATGQTQINSLWLWGEGNPDQLLLSKPGAVVYGDQFYVQCIADYLECRYEPLAAFADHPIGGNTLIVDDRLRSALASGDSQWYDSVLQEYESGIFQVLESASGQHPSLNVQVWTGEDTWLRYTPGVKTQRWFSAIRKRLFGGAASDR